MKTVLWGRVASGYGYEYAEEFPSAAWCIRLKGFQNFVAVYTSYMNLVGQCKS